MKVWVALAARGTGPAGTTGMYDHGALNAGLSVTVSESGMEPVFITVKWIGALPGAELWIVGVVYVTVLLPFESTPPPPSEMTQLNVPTLMCWMACT